MAGWWSRIAACAFGGQYVLVTLAALPLVLPFCWAILRYGAAVDRSKSLLPVIGVIVGALFFLNCSMPYLGLKTAQTLVEDIDRIVMPDWVNKWFHFQEVDLDQPEMCGVGAKPHGPDFSHKGSQA